MGDLRCEFQEVLQADEGKLAQMARLLASIHDLQGERDSLTSRLAEAQSSSEVAYQGLTCSCAVHCWPSSLQICKPPQIGRVYAASEQSEPLAIEIVAL